MRNRMSPPRRVQSFRLMTSPPRRRWENCRRVHARPTGMRARGEKRRLTIRRLSQIFNRSVPCNLAQLPLKNVVRFLKQVGCGRKLFRQVASHPDGLCALASEKQRDFFHAIFTIGVCFERFKCQMVGRDRRAVRSTLRRGQRSHANTPGTEISCTRWFTRQRKYCRFAL